MAEFPLLVPLPGEESTVLFGSDLAAALVPGDLVALVGDLGAGKSALARAVIRALHGDPALEVPSPTFSLVQHHDGRPPVAHLDLYRLGGATELEELGIDDALDEGVVLIEWADRFIEELPEPAIHIVLEEDGAGGRLARVIAAGHASGRLDRSMAIRAFLKKNGWGEGWRRPLDGDASARTYELVSIGQGEPRLIMDAPAAPDGPLLRQGKPYSRIAHLAENVTPFVAIAATLRRAGFAAPDIHAADLDAGLLLMEHLGDGRMLDDDGHPIGRRFVAAAGLLADLHRQDWSLRLEGPFGACHDLPDYDRAAMLAELDLLVDWYLPTIIGAPSGDKERGEHASAWNAVLDRLGPERSIVLRDYHSPNLIWRAGHQGRDRLGLIDFQDAVWGPTAYDLASLAQDARVTIDPELEQEIVAAYCAARRSEDDGFDEAGLRQDLAIMAVQRNAKILGIFIRLDRRDGKPAYLRHLPRIRDYMRRSMHHPALAPVLDLYQRWNVLCEPAS